jgi:uroporphyrinogen-III synthase
MTTQIRILSTKKLLTHQKQFLLNAGFNVMEANFIQTQYKPFELKNIHDNLIFTSQNAVQSLLENPDSEHFLSTLRTKKVFCVGLKTKTLLEENGFEVIAYTGYAADLAEIISLIYAKESYTFFCGNLRRDTLPDSLRQAGIIFNEIEVYETLLTPQKINSPLDGILFFSPSAVNSYLKENKIGKEFCFCIGDTTAEALKNITENIIVANQPTIENTIVQCINEYK